MPGTGPDTLDVVADGLNFPIVFDFGPDGALYVSSPAVGAAPGQGTIALLDLADQETGGGGSDAHDQLRMPRRTGVGRRSGALLAVATAGSTTDDEQMRIAGAAEASLEKLGRPP